MIDARLKRLGVIRAGSRTFILYALRVWARPLATGLRESGPSGGPDANTGRYRAHVHR